MPKTYQIRAANEQFEDMVKTICDKGAYLTEAEAIRESIRRHYFALMEESEIGDKGAGSGHPLNKALPGQFPTITPTGYIPSTKPLPKDYDLTVEEYIAKEGGGEVVIKNGTKYRRYGPAHLVTDVPLPERYQDPIQ